MDVIVVGAGPVGMATAAFLGRQGLSVGLVEKNANHYNQRSVRWYAMGADTQYAAQMVRYGCAVGDLYPHRSVRLSILWLATGVLEDIAMPLNPS